VDELGDDRLPGVQHAELLGISQPEPRRKPWALGELD
jgi:hypothetical protein